MYLSQKIKLRKNYTFFTQIMSIQLNSVPSKTYIQTIRTAELIPKDPYALSTPGFCGNNIATISILKFLDGATIY